MVIKQCDWLHVSVFAFLLCRNRPDCCILWLPVCRLRANHCATSTSTEHCNNIAYSQDDRRGNQGLGRMLWAFHLPVFRGMLCISHRPVVSWVSC